MKIQHYCKTKLCKSTFRWDKNRTTIIAAPVCYFDELDRKTFLLEIFDKGLMKDIQWT